MKNFHLSWTLWLLLAVLACAGVWLAGQGWVRWLWPLAVVKGLLVSERFMELDHAPMGWRLAVPLWLAATAAALALLLP